jgi:trehalose 6-phosphate phosphatase
VALRALTGAFLERKRYSLTIHYRLSPRAALTRRQALTIANALQPAPRIIAGKCVLNLLPPGRANKGEALRRMLENGRWENALFVGDDETDEDVFRLRDPRIFSVRVGRGKRSAADWYVPTQREVARLLRLLLAETKADTKAGTKNNAEAKRR